MRERQNLTVAAMMNIVPGEGGSDDRPDDVGLSDLLEVEACLREMLQTAHDPAVLQRLYNLHREITRYIAEITKNK